MPDPIITLTTDFGEESPYVAAMKGVILGVNPNARLVDLTHRIPPQNLRHTAFFLAATIPHFPRQALHVIVVDPGVGTDRSLLYVEASGQRLLTPDNGCWTVLEQSNHPPRVLRLTNASYWRQPASCTFHGRDILAPVAGHLSLGLDPEKLGEPLLHWVRLRLTPPLLTPAQLTGEVVFVDHYGNLLTNIPAEALLLVKRPLSITIGDKEIPRLVRTYGDAESGTLVALVSSLQTLEIAITMGNASHALQLGEGAPVKVTSGPERESQDDLDSRASQNEERIIPCRP